MRAYRGRPVTFPLHVWHAVDRLDFIDRLYHAQAENGARRLDWMDAPCECDPPSLCIRCACLQYLNEEAVLQQLVLAEMYQR